MEESYREGVASHSGPEPCEGGGNVALEALDRGICRLGIELRNREYGMPTLSAQTEGNTAVRASASVSRSCGVEDPKSMHRNSMRENRETPSPPARSERAGSRRR
jgi:hypothetical protein